MRLRKIFAVRALTLIEIRHGIQTQSIDAHLQPKIEHVEDRLVYFRVVEVKIGLMRVEAMPVVRFCHCIPGPVGRFEIFEDDSGVAVLLLTLAPDVEIPRAASLVRLTSALEPRMLI